MTSRGRVLRPTIGAFVAAILGVFAFEGASAQPTPRVLVIATGGTIAGQSVGGQLTGAQLVEAVPQLADVADIRVEEFSRIGSSAMTPDHWTRLSGMINARFDDDRSLAGIVVTHGTDTMEETAYFLHLTVAHARPVVMVGSMRNASAVSPDGPANLLSGVRVAASQQAQGKGVLVVLNDEIHSARDVRKADNNRVDTFESTEFGTLGIVDSDRILFRRTIATRHTIISDLQDAIGQTELPSVPIVADYAGNDGDGLRTAVAAGARGVVIQAFGGGRASPGMREAIAEVADRGVLIVIASRVPEGRIMSGASNPDVGVVSSGDLPPHKARVLAMLALQRDRAPDDIQRLFDTH